MSKSPTSAKLIVVVLETAIRKAADSGQVVFTFDGVTGSRHHPTELGHYRVLSRQTGLGSWIQTIPIHWALLMTHDGNSFHQYHGPIPLSIVRTLTDYVSDCQATQGCVQIAESDAKALYAWADARTQLPRAARPT
jgi:hypothetical protein